MLCSVWHEKMITLKEEDDPDFFYISFVFTRQQDGQDSQRRNMELKKVSVMC